MNRPKQLCPDFKNGCVHEECPAFKADKPSLWKCEICTEIHQTGGTCTDTSHKRAPVYIKEFYYCNKYRYRWESVED